MPSKTTYRYDHAWTIWTGGNWRYIFIPKCVSLLPCWPLFTSITVGGRLSARFGARSETSLHPPVYWHPLDCGLLHSGAIRGSHPVARSGRDLRLEDLIGLQDLIVLLCFIEGFLRIGKVDVIDWSF